MKLIFLSNPIFKLKGLDLIIAEPPLRRRSSSVSNTCPLDWSCRALAFSAQALVSSTVDFRLELCVVRGRSFLPPQWRRPCVRLRGGKMAAAPPRCSKAWRMRVSGETLARRCLDLGFYLSLSGITAFPKSDQLRAIFKFAPQERLLVETDSPYLAPPPHRGRRNEPAYVALTARAAATFFGQDYAAFAAQVEKNGKCC